MKISYSTFTGITTGLNLALAVIGLINWTEGNYGNALTFAIISAANLVFIKNTKEVETE